MKKVFVCVLVLFSLYTLSAFGQVSSPGFYQNFIDEIVKNVAQNNVPEECRNGTDLPVGRLLDKCQLKIRCGYTGDGDPRVCYTGAGQVCFACDVQIERESDGFWDDVGNWLADTFWSTKHEIKYVCSNNGSVPSSDCRIASKGGISGEQYYKATVFQGVVRGAGALVTGGLWGDVISIGDDKNSVTPGRNCIVSNILAVHGAQCYPCAVFEILFIAFMRAAEKAYDVSKEAGNVILFVCTLIWLALFVLKNVSSFAAVDPMMMLQQMTVQFFKVMLAFVIINSGIKTILHYTLVPIISVGTDISKQISDTVLQDLFYKDEVKWEDMDMDCNNES